MKRLKSNLAVLLFAVCGFALLLLTAQPAKAALYPTASDNLAVSLRRKSDLVNTDNGYMRVYYNGTSIGIEYYDYNFNVISKKTVAMELPVWGGFYAGSDGYYIVEGRNNESEDDGAEIIRVIKYDTHWRRIGAASITGNKELFGGEVRYPFDYGCVEFAEQGGRLYIVTAHEGYVDPVYGQGHQGFLMIAVEKASMTGKIVDCDLWHSFAQYIKSKDSYLYVLEQSEGSRYTKLSRYDSGTMEKTSIPVLKYGGSKDSAWAIECYASVDGMALSKDHVLCLGTSIDQSQYDTAYSSGAAHNIYLTVTPMQNFSESATKVKWFTDYTGNHKAFLGAKITKINDNRFMISWEEYDTTGNADVNDSLSSSILHYLFIDGKGNKLTGEYTAAAPISGCQPIVKDSRVVFYASNSNAVNFYSIHTDSGVLTKHTYRVLGDNATWFFSQGVLTISGTGKIALPEEAWRGPVSSTSGGFSYTTGSRWPAAIADQTKKIVIKTGITGIEEEVFRNFDNLEEVVLETGIQSIGDKAFYSCRKLRKITIPASVTRIGKDILWTGYTWVGTSGHVVYAVIYAPKGSYGIQYAKQNGIQYKIDLSNAAVSGIKSVYQYTGKALKPSVKVKLGSQTLKEDRDYKVTYKNNKKVGTATVTISGLGNYCGKVEKTFKITKKSGTSKKNIKKCSIKKIKPQRYTGKSVKPVLTIKDGSRTLKQGTHYTVTYKNNKKVGNASVVITGKGSYSGSVSKRFTIKYMTPAKGKTVKVSGAYYKIMKSGDSGTAEVQYVKPVNKKKANVSIPEEVKISRVTCRVTSIAANAFRDNKYIKAVHIGKNVVTIGNQAFYDCSRLKTIVIKSPKLKSKTVGSDAFGRIYRKAVVKVPAKQKKSYAKMLKTKGMSVKVKFVKE